ncbi:hypothetical protein PHA51_06710 [Rodentibacter pneumotropicus]|uniref:hypothetical protein n=1 Tax=Rodentibacter pneumotropicus TaxID=758 RepID=UPI0018655BE9|nr:hypothetical protein [Rodentibacter pneumotropicus]MDC2825728.1 hypothetical protein [Rodentibacter pneumotropicus]
MHTVKITFESGDHVITRIKGTENDIRTYYAIGSTIGFDNRDRIVRVEFIS